eukprot:SAG11_NODE_754_length_7332_cov_5.256325_9_plen_26_part_01
MQIRYLKPVYRYYTYTLNKFNIFVYL